ncbi:hypothetical protein FXN61_03635 [Lentzea sp. PSKA42]|uniref:Uncharacterized protein n=1 Tax=Lentzea indica TaxID=2604800 RepID=A0ABX1FB93_9PSEU|nr:hypothetical protein [Lentzea indica]NKE55966.1 hypothetical protein [Lentzea indica]
MAGAVGIVFGLCVLSFTLGAALMYVLVRRREDRASVSSASDVPAERVWAEKPVAVEPVEDDYDSRPIHRNPVVGLPQLEPALAVLAEPVGEAESVGADRYDRDGDLDPPVGELEAPESTVAAGTDSPEIVDEAEPLEPEPVAEAEPEPVEGVVEEPEPEPEPVEDVVEEPEQVPEEPVVAAELPPPAAPQRVEQTTWVEREDFRQRYLRTFEEVRRKAGSN